MNQPIRSFIFAWLALLVLVIPLRGQKLVISPETKLITYDTAFTLNSLPADSIFDKAKGWFIYQATDLNAEIRFENKPVQLAGVFTLIHPSSLNASVRYVCEMTLKIEDGAMEIIIDNMMAIDSKGKQTGTMESTGVRSDGTFRTGSSFAKHNSETTNECNRIVANLNDFIHGTSGKLYVATEGNQQNQSSGTTPGEPTEKFYARLGFSLIGGYDDKDEGQLLPGFTFCPGFRLMQSRSQALTLSFPITLGWWRESYFGIDAPIMLDVHLGAAAGNNPDARVGLIAGAGLAYFYAETETPFSSYSVAGYRLQGGLVFGKAHSDSRNAIIVNYGKSTAAGDTGKVIGISFQWIMTND